MRRYAIASLAFVATLSLAPGISAASPGGEDAHLGMAARASHPSAPETSAVSSAAALREGLRKLWSDHAIWTRQYIVAAVPGTADHAAAAGRLLRNQEDIGAAIVPFYGDAAGATLTKLLKEHILIAVDVIAAAKAGDTAAYKKADAAWHKNGRDIAHFLSQANPNWPYQELADMMDMHLATTTEEVVARLNKDWEGDVRSFDVVYEHLLHMSDTLADGIVAQFPDRFSPTN